MQVGVTAFPEHRVVLPAFPGDYDIAPVVDAAILTAQPERASISLPGTFALAPTVSLDAQASQ